MRLIDADALSEKIEALMNRYAAQGRTEVAEDYNFVLTVLMTAETIDPESLRPKGRWILSGMGFDCCSECRKAYSSGYLTAMGIKPRMHFDFCPNCGARMEG